MTTYDKYPCVRIDGHEGEAQAGWQAVRQRLKEAAAGRTGRFVLTIDCYPGVLYDELERELVQPLAPSLSIQTDEAVFKTAQQITDRVRDRMTDDRVFGQMCLETYSDLIDPEKLLAAQKRVESAQGLVIIWGVGARLVAEPDCYVYADMARWKLQCRFRKGMIPEWKCSEKTEDNLKKFKWGYFFAWRVADRHKKRWLMQADYLLDTNKAGEAKLLTGAALRAGLAQTVKQPFRVVPFFDPGVWGGQWMKKVCGLPENNSNYAWCFDCVPEEDSLLLACGDTVVEIPSIDVVFFHPETLLGPKVFARFGAEFPIRFDFLDTVGGQNLSLQVHPLVGYIQDHFGMHYTQVESYYILDAVEESDTAVYLGVKTGVTRDELIGALQKAQETGERFEDERYINRIPVRKHDHVLIPPGTIHCSGADTMVLEVSATPYIFTFKLWDWGRLGMDGKPRPIHLEHGKEVIRFERDTEFVKRELVNHIERRVEEDGHIREATGLHPLELIESEREWFDREILCETRGSVNVLNLVEGGSMTICPTDGSFEPFEVHYAETVIIPENIKQYKLVPGKADQKSRTAPYPYGVLIARVRM